MTTTKNTETCGTESTAPGASRRTKRPSAGMLNSSQSQIPAQEIPATRVTVETVSSLNSRPLTRAGLL